MTNSLEARIEKLESLAVFQDRAIAELDQVVRQFAARVEDLERELSRVKEIANGAPPVGPQDDPPPHY